MYDALVSERVYKKAISHEKAIEMILNGECDSIPESCFLFTGTIDDVFEKAKNNQNQ